MIPDDVKSKLSRLMRASIRGEGLDAEDLAYIERCYRKYPDGYGALHRSIKAAEFEKASFPVRKK